jgi:hypothetical protein
MGDFSSFLFARPSFTEGVARIMDIGNTMSEYNLTQTPSEADLRAFMADWAAIGEDLRGAIGHVVRASEDRC